MEEENYLEYEDIIFTISAHLDAQRRTYDVLLAILAASSPEAAKSLQEIHQEGKYLFPPPWADAYDEDDAPE